MIISKTLNVVRCERQYFKILHRIKYKGCIILQYRTQHLIYVFISFQILQDYNMHLFGIVKFRTLYLLHTVSLALQIVSLIHNCLNIVKQSVLRKNQHAQATHGKSKKERQDEGKWRFLSPQASVARHHHRPHRRQYYERRKAQAENNSTAGASMIASKWSRETG